MGAFQYEPWVRLRSSWPGRQRWDVFRLKGKPAIARRVAARLLKAGGMHEVRANPITGRVLIVFDVDTLTNPKALLLEVFDEFGLGDPQRRRRRRKLGRQAKTPPSGTAASVGTPQILEPLQLLAQEIQDSELLGLVRSLEGSPALRRSAGRWTVLNTMASLTPPMALAGLMGASVLRGLPFLTAIGLSPMVQFWGFAGIFLAGNYLNTVTEYNSKLAWHAYAADIERKLRSKAFGQVLDLEQSSLEELNTSQILGVVHDDAVKLRRFLTDVPDSLLDRVSTLAAGGAFLIWISPVSFALSLVPIPVLVLLYRRYHHEIAERYGRLGAQEQSTRKRLSNSLTGLTTIQSFTTEAFEQEKLDEAALDLESLANEAFSEALRYADYSKFIMIAGMGLPIIYTGRLLLLSRISPTVFMFQSFIMPKLIGVMGGLDGLYDEYHSASAAARRISELLDQRPSIVSGGQSLAASSIEGDVRLEGVCFKYPSASEPVLIDFDLHIPARRSVAIVGASGSGKSTITRLLLRFHDIDAGQITLDGHDLRDLDIGDLRRAIGLVSQDVFLFHGTVLDNIAYGRPEASQEQVREAARIANALDFIEALPDGFDTVVGERGQKLSGGQRQRISIARVVLKDPPVLIFDEATSSVDNETEEEIQKAIHAIARNKTLVVIAHRMSTVRRVDRIVVLDEGRVIEHGTHDELLRREGGYAALWALQTQDGGSVKPTLPASQALPSAVGDLMDPAERAVVSVQDRP